MRNKFSDSNFGFIFGLIVNILICGIAVGFPFVMIDASWWVDALIILVITLYRPAAILLWIWGLICAINGEQTIVTILYYISFAIVPVSILISFIRGLFDN